MLDTNENWFGLTVVFTMPNRPVKSTALLSEFQSKYFS